MRLVTKFRAVFALLAFLFSGGALAAEYSRTAAVLRIHPISQVRPAAPETQNVMRVYVTVGAWGASGCRADAVDISGDDWLLISTFMSAWKEGRTLTFYVDDTMRLVPNDTVCKLTTMGIE